MKKILIIGGGFVGSHVAQELEKEKGFDVTLIDTKDYFEFTPSILRTIVEPEHVKKIQVLHRHYLPTTHIILGEVTELREFEVTYISKDKVSTEEFDYVVIASGSQYSFPLIKAKDLVIATRGDILRDCHEKLTKSNDILIIGGGLVGVELAAEIVEHYKKEKNVTIVHDRPELIARNHAKAISYCTEFLKARGVNFRYNEKVIEHSGDEYITDKKTTMKPDMAFLCTGIIPNYEFMKKHFSKVLNSRNQIDVNEFLQVERYKHIFCAGDINNIREEKTAQNAEKQAQLIVSNISRHVEEKPLIPYVMKEKPIVISLGKKNGVLQYKGFVMSGWLIGILKNYIEWKSMRRFR